MRGRKPTPTKLKLLKGNPGKRPIRDDEPQPDVEIPEPPEELSADAQAEWERVTPMLYELGLLSQIDRAALTAYCVAWGRWMEAEAALKKHGVVVKSPNGFPVQSPFLAVANRAMKQVKEFLAEFGVSPSSRTRVSASKKPAEGNPFGKIGSKAG